MGKRSSWFFVLTMALMASSARAYLPPYTTIQFENGSTRDHTLDEMMTMLQITPDDLIPFHCDGIQEFTLLPPLLLENPEGTSLRIRVPSTGEILIYGQGDLPLKDAFVKSVMESLAKLEKLPSGRVLLQRLQHSPYPLTIALGDPRFGPVDDAGKLFWGLTMSQAIQNLVEPRWADFGFQFTHIGAGGMIFFNPNLKTVFIESDDRQRIAPSHIVMAHEMYHAFDGIRGLLDRRMVNGEGYEFIEITEYRATFLENQIREESGLKYRKYYSTTPEKGSLLGVDGKPMLLPAPCMSGVVNKAVRRVSKQSF